MPTDTLIDVINDVFREVGNRTNKTVIGDTDETGFVRNRINDALAEIYGLQPFNVDVAGSTVITPSTRTFSGPTGTDLNNIHTWSFRVNNAPVAYVTNQFIITHCPDFETAEGASPSYVYFAEGGRLAIYPMLTAGAANLTLKFLYSTQFTRLTAAAATFPFEDGSDEMRYVKLCAQRDYELRKALGQPDATALKAMNLWAKLVAKYRKGKRFGITGACQYGR
jgi:hypothetical protein